MDIALETVDRLDFHYRNPPIISLYDFHTLDWPTVLGHSVDPRLPLTWLQQKDTADKALKTWNLTRSNNCLQCREFGS